MGWYVGILRHAAVNRQGTHQQYDDNRHNRSET
jgi:hypothetical protein